MEGLIFILIGTPLVIGVVVTWMFRVVLRNYGKRWAFFCALTVVSGLGFWSYKLTRPCVANPGPKEKVCHMFSGLDYVGAFLLMAVAVWIAIFAAHELRGG